MLATRAVMATAVGALACALPMTVSPAAAESSWVTGPSLVQHWAPTYMGGKAPSTADVTAIAKRFDVLAVQSETFSSAQISTMKTANPRLRILVYLNGSFAHNIEAPGSSEGYPDSMYALDINGAHPYSMNFGSWLMKMWQKPWRENRAQKCAYVVSRNPGASGCFLDMLGVAPIHGTYLSAPPVNDSGARWNDGDWMAATSGLAEYVASANPTLAIMGNGLGNGRYYFNMGTSRLASSVHGGMAEAFIRGAQDGVTSFRPESSWKSDVDMLVDAGKNGRSVFATVKLWRQNTVQDATRWHKYTLASFLLGTDGRQYYNFSSVKTFNGMTATSPAYDDVDVGQPLPDANNLPVSYKKGAGGCYTRTFTRGVAVVNPTKAPCTTALPAGTYKDLDGRSHSGTITLAVNTGEVYTLAA